MRPLTRLVPLALLLLAGFGEPVQINCYQQVVYDGFEAGRRYRLEVRPQLRRALALLSDERGEVVARSNFQTSRCPPY